MKELLFQGKEEEAAEIADSINWNKVRNVNDLVKAGEIYEKVGRYEESREIFLNAYDRSPIGRTIIYRLAEIAIKMQDYDGAQEYYDEFVSIAPHDNQRYILMYRIKKAQGASYEELIPILEEFKEQEYTEEWAFELAYLYHKAGRKKECLEACDELVLWFGDGPYVERALKLKMLYKPLAKTQDEKQSQVQEETEKEIVIPTENIPYTPLAEKENQKIEKTQKVAAKFNFQNVLGEDTDGQIRLIMKEKAVSEPQIKGQITLKEILEEWEEPAASEDEDFAEPVLTEAKEDFESVKAKALQEAEDIMIRLNDVLPKIETAKTPEELFGNVNSILDKEIARVSSENNEIDEQLRRLERELLLSAQQTAPKVETNFTVFENLETKKKTESRAFERKALSPQPNVKIEAENLSDVDFTIEDVQHLTEKQKAIFSYFVPVKGMEAQLCKTLSNMKAYFEEYPHSSAKNLVIQGCQGCGKTVLATSIIKVLQEETGRLTGKVGKIDAAALNQKDIKQLLKKVAGGCLIIEKAGDLDKSAVFTLSLILEQENSGVFLILEDTAAGMKKVLSMDSGFAKKFSEVINVPIFTNDELIGFANSYANELGYVIDEMAVLALHNRISNIEKLDQVTTLVEVKDIIDGAVEKEANGGIRKALNILTAKRYTDDDKIVLTEKDFE